jgi:putative ABC transport system permease protein
VRLITNSFRFFRRELLQPEMRLVFLSLLVTVTAMATVGLLTDRIAGALQRQSNELLGADLVIASSRPIPDEWRAYAAAQGLNTTEYREFPSVLITTDDSSLVEVKAVANGYPLRGKFIARSRQGQLIGEAIPAPGRVWVENNLLRKLGLELGDKITLGKLSFDVTAVIEQEPDRGGNLFALAPRVLMNLADLPATELIGEGSRVRHRLLIAGDADEIDIYQKWVRQRLGQNYQLQSVRESRPEVNASLDRAERFLSLSLVVTLVLASLATWVAMQAWVKKRLTHAAVLRTLGLTRHQIVGIYLAQLLLLTLLACVLAVLASWGLQHLFVQVMQSYMAATLPQASIMPALVACVLGLLLVFAFSLPAYWQLASTSPMLVLRAVPDRFERVNWSLLWGLVVLTLIMAWLTADLKLLLVTLAGLAASIVLLALLALALLALLKVAGRRLPASWRMGIYSLTRHRRETVIGISVFGLAFVFVILLTLIRTDLLDQWRDRLPLDTPNTFLINIQPHELPGITGWLQDNGLDNVEFSPTVRARLIRINEHRVSGDDYDTPRAKRLAKREFNLSWSDQLPSHNQLTTGDWWNGSDSEVMPQWSVESGIAETLGIQMGDELTYDMAGKLITGRVTSLREVSWDSFKVNFFVIGTTPMLSSLPTRYISSFYLPESKKDLMNAMVRQYPSVTVLDVDALMKRVRTIIDKVSYAAEAAFVFTLLAAMLLLVAIVASGRHIRRKENALFRAIGATTELLNKAQRLEFILIGGSAGIIAVFVSNLLAWIVSNELLGIGFHFNFTLAAGVVAAGIMLMLITGWALLSQQQSQTPDSILRQS